MCRSFTYTVPVLYYYNARPGYSHASNLGTLILVPSTRLRDTGPGAEKGIRGDSAGGGVFVEWVMNIEELCT